MTYGKRQFENLDGMMRKLIPPFHQAMNELLLMVDADSSAFNSYMVRRTLGNISLQDHSHSHMGNTWGDADGFFTWRLSLFSLQAALKMPKNTAEETKR